MTLWLQGKFCACAKIVIPEVSQVLQSLHETWLTSFLDPNGGPVVDGVLLVVDGSVVPDQFEILLKVIQTRVDVVIHLLTHGVEVHWLFDDV